MVEPDDLDELLRAAASRDRRRMLSEVWERERGAGDLAEELAFAPNGWVTRAQIRGPVGNLLTLIQA